ncbi:MAG TPA: hypothetical protein VN654_22075 [Vicinamibacterales bacterium]|jgi:hypothetical protein|nr:hypothetical protein [Vicinamibacterales bacterium]
MTRFRLAAVAILGLAVLAGTASAQSKDDPSIGSWKLNVAKSTFTPGPAIKGDTRSYEVNDEGWLIVTTETIQPDGRRTGVRFAAKFDGKAYPQIGRFAPTVTLITYQPVDKLTLKYTQRDSSGKVNSTNTRTVSADGRTMTIEQKTTDDKGRAVVNVELFERQ